MVPWKAWVRIDWLKYQDPLVDLTITKTNPSPLLETTVFFAWPHRHCHQSSGGRESVRDLVSQAVSEHLEHGNARTWHCAAAKRRLQKPQTNQNLYEK